LEPESNREVKRHEGSRLPLPMREWDDISYAGEFREKKSNVIGGHAQFGGTTRGVTRLDASIQPRGSR
jgi:hypothetical protein